MCEHCGCAITAQVADERQSTRQYGGAKTETVEVLRNLLAENDRLAAHNRAHFDAHGVLVVNLMSSPGAGKTSLLESTVQVLRPAWRVAVIEGDLATENDAQRIRAKGIRAVQITTGSACHLDARMVHQVLEAIELDGLDVLFIENVGNLVCPASFDLGQHVNVALLSVPEGDDKPQKYPVLFRAADLVLITKTDLLTVLPEFQPARVRDNLRALTSDAPVLPVSCRAGGEGLAAWCAWLDETTAAHRAGTAPWCGSGGGGARTSVNQLRRNR